MDIEKAIDILSNFDMQVTAKADGAYQSTIGEKACKYAVEALEELEQYRQIGTVDELKNKIAELERWHTDRTNEKIKNPFANTSTLICHNCDHKDEYIEELESQIEEYEKIGTIDECKSAMEKQIPQKPELIEVKTQGLVGDGTHTDKVSYQSDAYECPKCGSFLGFKTDCCDDEHYQDSFCPDCGQKLKWGD